MQKAGIEPDASTYEHIVLHFVEFGYLEMALQNALDAQDRGLRLTRQTIEPLISFVAASDCSRLALDLLNKWESSEVAHVSNPILVDVLAASAEAHYVGKSLFSRIHL